MIRKLFVLEGIEGTFAGYTDGTYWNGFENPWFDEDTTIKVLNALVDNNDHSQQYSWEYDGETHSFQLWWTEGGITEPLDNLMPQEIEDKTLYCWGWGWCWYEASRFVS